MTQKNYIIEKIINLPFLKSQEGVRRINLEKSKETSGFQTEYEYGNLVEVIIILRNTYVVNNDSGRSFKLFKSVTTIKYMLNIKIKNRPAD